MNGVLQDWVAALPPMQQGVLLSAVRGPDGLAKHHPVKMFVRWYRRCILVSAYMGGKPLEDPFTNDHGGSFTGAWQGDDFEDAPARFPEYVDELNTHYLMHFLHAVEIVGYKHPNPMIRVWWRGLYDIMVDDLHLNPETEEQMDTRLGHKS